MNKEQHEALVERIDAMRVNADFRIRAEMLEIMRLKIEDFQHLRATCITEPTKGTDTPFNRLLAMQQKLAEMQKILEILQEFTR